MLIKGKNYKTLETNVITSNQENYIIDNLDINFIVVLNYNTSIEEKLLKMSKGNNIITVDKDNMLSIENSIFNFHGPKEFAIFEEGNIHKLNNKISLKEKYNKITNAQELMNFMNKYILYGWKNINNEIHLSNLKNIKTEYKVNTLDEILTYGLGTCIEQVKLEKDFFDKQNIENKIYCEVSPSKDENEMHAFLLYKENDKWYHFEHSDKSKRGIHEYKNINDALENIKIDGRILKCINEIEDNITLEEVINKVLN